MMFDHPDNEPVLVLTDEQCWKLLERIQHGRLVTVVEGQADIFPINVAAQERTLVVRTAPGSKLDDVLANQNVVFEADGILSDQAWSVVVRGTAKHLQTAEEIAEAQSLQLRPWVPTPKDHYVRITPTEVSGRHFQFGPHAESEQSGAAETDSASAPPSALTKRRLEEG